MPPQERTPLLSDRHGLPLHRTLSQVHDPVPIFLRVCHSAWTWPTQGALVVLRGLIFLYLTGIGPALLRYLINHNNDGGIHTPWSVLFDFPTVTFSLHWVYNLLSFIWSLMHHWSPVLDDDDRRWKARVLSTLSPPNSTPCSRKSFYFSLFYTAAHVFNFMNTIIYWAVLVPQGYGNFPHGDGDAVAASLAPGFFGNGWFQPFSIINLYGITSLISWLEILFLNSIKRQSSVWKHVLALALSLAGYLGWGSIGKCLTGHHPFFWMNPEEVGKTGLAVYVSGFVGLGFAVFVAMYGLTVLREKLSQQAGRRARYDPIQDSDGGHAAGSRA